MSVVNVSAYKFTPLNSAELSELQTSYRQEAKRLEIKGTILLSREGINLFLAGKAENISQFKHILSEKQAFSDLHYKQTLSEKIPFKRLYVKIKKEIITFGVDSIKPHEFAAPYIAPEQLKEWYAADKEIIVLDTRNKYEVEMGKFERALHLNIESFKEFAEAVHCLPKEYKQKPIVTYCTMGIRCEKAATFMLAQGFKEVYQLHGGIINYFEQCGGDYYDGECFLFDERIAYAPSSTKKAVIPARMPGSGPQGCET